MVKNVSNTQIVLNDLSFFLNLKPISLIFSPESYFSLIFYYNLIFKYLLNHASSFKYKRFKTIKNS